MTDSSKEIQTMESLLEVFTSAELDDSEKRRVIGWFSSRVYDDINAEGITSTLGAQSTAGKTLVQG